MDNITQDDLRQLRILLLNDIEKLLEKRIAPQEIQPEWLRSKAVRTLMNISPATLQNLRITGKVNYRKIMGSYYYSKADLSKLFGDGDE